MKLLFIIVVALVLVTQTVNAQDSDSTYTVRPGDTLYSISTAHGTSVDALRQLNDIGEGVIRAGMILIIRASTAAGMESTSFEQNKVTLASLAQTLGLSQENLTVLNPDIQNVVNQLNGIEDDSDETPKIYRVKPGSTLFGIARSNGLTLDELKSLNEMRNSNIRSDQVLKISKKTSQKGAVWQLQGDMLSLMYPETYSGRMMGSGLEYDPSASVISHPALSIGTIVMLGAEDSAERVLCIVADHSLSLDPPVLDVSEAVAKGVGNQLQGRRLDVFTLR